MVIITTFITTVLTTVILRTAETLMDLNSDLHPGQSHDSS